LFGVEAHPTVWQMTSTVKAELRQGVDLEHIFEVLFPCGSITGAPKIKAMEIIATREEEPRGIYCGAVGMLRPGGDAVFNVAIRTVVVDAHSGVGRYGAGGGITADSIAGNEYDEVLAKCLVIQGGARAKQQPVCAQA
jgi:para-aminobenzoate synthetase/4-amino-4-deoxychorismate lyase